MPNVVENFLVLSGSESEIIRFKEKLNTTPCPITKNSKYFFDVHEGFCHTYLPCPKILTKVSGPNKPYWKETNKELTEGEIIDLKTRYGCSDWYTWEIINYGNKWGDYNTVMQDYGKPTALLLKYDSAWGQINSALVKLSEMFLLKFENFSCSWESSFVSFDTYLLGNEDNTYYLDFECFEEINETIIDENYATYRATAYSTYMKYVLGY